ncbi:MAG: AbrB/MazE/SpoVT family DNA-binding domain-containing protein [Nitrososphaeraceae archaeon]
MALVKEETKRDIQLRRVLEFHNQSNSLGITIPAEWCERLHLEPKQYVKLQLDEDNSGFHVERIWFQET